MEFTMRGILSEAKIKSGGIRIVIENADVRDLTKLSVLLELEKEVDIFISDGQSQLLLEDEETG